MFTWKTVQAVYDQYQEDKGSFRKFFSLDSIFMVSLAAMLPLQEALSTPLTYSERFALIELIFLHAPKATNRLTHQLAYQLANQCVPGDQQSSVIAVFQILHQLQLFNEEIFTSVLTHSHRNYLCVGLLSWHNAVLTKHIAAQAQQDYKDKTLAIAESVACLWGDFQITIGNAELGHEQHRAAMRAKAVREGSTLSALQG